MDIGRVGIWTFPRAAAGRARAGSRRGDRVARLRGALDPRGAWAARRSPTPALLLAGTRRIAGRDRHRQHLGARRDGDGGRAEDARRGLPRPLPARHGREPRAARRGMRGHDYEKPLTVHAQLPRRDGRGAVPGAVPPSRRRQRVIGALAPKMLALAARAHRRASHPYFVPPEHTARAREIIGAGAAARAGAGASSSRRDAATARAIARAHMAIYLGLPNYAEQPAVARLRRRRRRDGGSDRLVDAIVAWGDVDAIARARARAPRRRRRSRLRPGARRRPACAAAPRSGASWRRRCSKRDERGLPAGATVASSCGL